MMSFSLWLPIGFLLGWWLHTVAMPPLPPVPPTPCLDEFDLPLSPKIELRPMRSTIQGMET